MTRNAPDRSRRRDGMGAIDSVTQATSYVKTLLHMNGADASTTFTEETGKTFTANGNAQIDTGQSVFGGASGLFNGTGDYLSSADHGDWRLDDGSNANAWTIDFRVRFNGDPGTASVGFVQQRVDNSNFWALQLANNTLFFVVQSGGSTIVNINAAWNPAGNTWYHVAIVKNGVSGYMLFIDGTQIGVTTTDVDPIPDYAGGLLVARYTDVGGVNNDLNGWIDELRISKGIARWTANFTPPTSEYGID